MKTKSVFLAILLALAFVITSNNAFAEVEVVVQNASKQPFSPPLVVLSKKPLDTFDLGGVASEGLWTIAETGNNSVLDAELSALDGVRTAAYDGGIIFPPNQDNPLSQGVITIDMPLEQLTSFRYVYVVAMFGCTNDGVFLAQTDLGKTKGLRSFYLKQGLTLQSTPLDVGSEENTQAVGDVGCLGGGNARVTETAEGYISTHQGILSGVGDMDPAVYGWGNPAGVVTIKLVH